MRTATLATLTIAAVGLVFSNIDSAAAHEFDECYSNKKFICAQISGVQTWSSCLDEAHWRCSLHEHGDLSGRDIIVDDVTTTSTKQDTPRPTPQNAPVYFYD